MPGSTTVAAYGASGPGSPASTTARRVAGGHQRARPRRRGGGRCRDTGVRTTCSIFIDSSTTTTAPAGTGSPGRERQQDHGALQGGVERHLGPGLVPPGPSPPLAVALHLPVRPRASGRWRARRRPPPWPPPARPRPSACPRPAAARAVAQHPGVARACRRRGRPGSRGRSARPGRPRRPVVYGSYQVAAVWSPSGPRSGGGGLDGHDPDVVLGGVGEQRLGVAPVVGVGPQPGIDREHHRVEVVAPERLEMGGRCGELVPGDPHPAGQPLVTGGQDGLARPGPGRRVRPGR